MSRLCQGVVRGSKLSVLSRGSFSTMSQTEVKSSDITSIHSDSVEDVHQVPMRVIIRPLPPVLDEEKVQSLMKTIKVRYVFVIGFALYMVVLPLILQEDVILFII